MQGKCAARFVCNNYDFRDPNVRAQLDGPVLFAEGNLSALHPYFLFLLHQILSSILIFYIGVNNLCRRREVDRMEHVLPH